MTGTLPPVEFDLSDDQLALADAANALLDDLASPARVRAVVDSGTGFDPDLWAAMIEQGWCGIAVAAERGGVGLGWVEAAVLAEAVGSRVAPAATEISGAVPSGAAPASA